jgi:prolyl-tRNA editing enzyme YbaK/EbsC (Cys-tRNA(Pro) deacylase)
LGRAIGGVAPCGHQAPLRVLVDRAPAGFDEVWAAGGIVHAVFPSTFAELVAVTGAEPADVA